LLRANLQSLRTNGGGSEKTVSLNRFLKDLAILSLFLGLVFACLFSIFFYIQTKDTNYAILGFVLGVLAGLLGIAHYIYWREVLKPILDV